MNQQDSADPRPVVPAAVSDAHVVNGAPRTPKESPAVTGSPHDLERDHANTNAVTAQAAAFGVEARGDDLPNTTSNRMQGAAPAWAAEAVRAHDFQQIQQGWAVFGSDGEQLGEVQRTGPGWLAVPYGTSDEHTMYIPENYIETVTNKRVVLSQPAGLLIDMKLDAPPGDFPTEREAVSGVRHDPRRAESGSDVIAEPSDLPAQIPPALSVQANDGLRSEEQALTGSRDVLAAAEREVPAAAGGGQNPMPRSSDAEHSAEHRGRGADAALQPAEPDVDQSEPRPPAMQSSVGRGRVATASMLIGAAKVFDEVSTRMDAPPSGEYSSTRGTVNGQHTLGGSFEARTGYTVLSSDEKHEMPGGPTHESGVREGRESNPNRTMFSTSGVAGANKERNVTDLDLTKNRHPEGSAFDSQESTVGRALAPGEPSIAGRSLPPRQ